MKKLFILFSLLLILSINLYSKYWKEIQNIPTPYKTNYWLDIYFLSSNPSFGWVCGFNGMVIRTTDGGNNWIGSQVPGAYHLESIHFTSTTVGYTSGVEGIFKSTDGGATWTNVTPDEAGFYWGTYFLNDNYGMVVGEGCGTTKQNFYLTTNGGSTWSLFQGTEPNSGLTDVMLYGVGGLGFASSSGKIWKTMDGGMTWAIFANVGPNVWQEEITNVVSSFLVPYAGSNCSGGGGTGGMKFTTDNGNSWNDKNTGRPMFGTFLNSMTEGWACGDLQGIFHTTDAGLTWKIKNCKVQDGNFDDLYFVDNNNGWVVGKGVYKLNKSEILLPDTLFFNDVCLNDSSTKILYIENLSFDDTEMIFSLGGTNSSDFRIVTPQSGDFMAPCDNTQMQIRYFTKDTSEKNAFINFVFNTLGESPISKTVYLKGKTLKNTSFPQDTSLIINNLTVGRTILRYLRYYGDNNEQITKYVQTSKFPTPDVALNNKLPIQLYSIGNNLEFQITPRDTGWFTEVFKITTQPCDRDTTIYIRYYGTSPIINSIKLSSKKYNCEMKGFDTIYVENNGNAELDIPSLNIVESNTPFKFIKWLDGSTFPVKIAPNSKKAIIIYFEIKSPGTYISNISINNNDLRTVDGIKHPWIIQLESIVERANPKSIQKYDFGKICLGKSINGSIPLYNYGNSNCDLSKAEFIDKKLFSVVFPQPLPYSIFKFDSIYTQISLKPSKLGLITDTVTFIFLPCLDTVKVELIAEVVNDDIDLSPGSISMSLKTGKSDDFKLNVQSLSNNSISIKNVYLNPATNDFTLSYLPSPPVVLLPTQSTTFNCTILANNDASYTGTICVEFDGNCPGVKCVPITLFSKSRFVSIDKNNIDFGVQYCNSITNLDSVSITNNGVEQDTITTIDLSDKVNFSITNMPSLPYYLPSNESLKLYVSYHPVNTKISNSQIIITTKDPEGQTLTVNLKGEYNITKFTPSDTLIDLGNLEICDMNRTFKVNIKNIGDYGRYLMIDPLKNEMKLVYNPVDLTLQPDQSVDFNFELFTDMELHPGKFESDFQIVDTLCNQVLCLIHARMNIIRPKLLYFPTKINFENIWVDRKVDTNIRVTNLSDHPRTISKLEIDNPLFTTNLQVPKIVPAKDNIFIPISFQSSKSGEFQTKVTIIDESKCIDTNYIEITVKVPLEQYRSSIWIDSYIADPGSTLTFPLTLDSAIDKFTSSKIDLQLSFDKYLFYPEKVFVRNDNKYSETSFLYNDGLLSCSVDGLIAENLLKNTGDIFKIEGSVLLSNPDSTILKIKEFNLNTSKDITIFKKDGSLKIDNYCKAISAYNRLQFIPELSVLSDEIAENSKLKMDIKTTKNQFVNIDIYNLLGEKVKSVTFEVVVNNNQYLLNLESLPSGIYLLKLKSEFLSTFSNKFLIKD